jgi:peptidoglycan hydrolase CwlO-like protein
MKFKTKRQLRKDVDSLLHEISYLKKELSDVRLDLELERSLTKSYKREILRLNGGEK